MFSVLKIAYFISLNTYFSAQKIRLIEIVLLSIHKTCLRLEVRKQKNKLQVQIVILTISLIICFGYSKEPSQCEGSLNTQNIFFGKK